MKARLERMQAKFSQIKSLKDMATDSVWVKYYDNELSALALNMHALQGCIEAHEIDSLRNSLRTAVERKQGHSIYLVR